MLCSVSSVAMKQLWGEGNYHTEFDDMMKEKAVTKGTKIMNVLEVLKEPSIYPQLGTMLLLLLSLQLCGLSAVEYTLFPCIDLLWRNRSTTIPTCHFPLDLHYSSSHSSLPVKLCGIIITSILPTFKGTSGVGIQEIQLSRSSCKGTVAFIPLVVLPKTL